MWRIGIVDNARGPGIGLWVPITVRYFEFWLSVSWIKVLRHLCCRVLWNWVKPFGHWWVISAIESELFWLFASTCHKRVLQYVSACDFTFQRHSNPVLNLQMTGRGTDRNLVFYSYWLIVHCKKYTISAQLCFGSSIAETNSVNTTPFYPILHSGPK